MTTKHNTNRRWSSNVTYTGLAKIHSELLHGAAARNSVVNRRFSNTITTESTMHQKDLRSLDLNKKALENSMLAYSQKMREIASHKSILHESHKHEHDPHKFEDRPRITVALRHQVKPIITNAFVRDNPDLNTLDKNEPSEECEIPETTGEHLSSTDASEDSHGRLSIDSGVSIESSHGGYDSQNNHDLSDSYFSDNESIASSSCHTVVSDFGPSRDTKTHILTSKDDCLSLDIENTPETKRSQRKRLCRRWRVDREKPQLPTVHDEDSLGSELEQMPMQDINVEQEQLLSIVPFPANCTNDSANLNFSTYNERPHKPSRISNVSSPLTSRRHSYWSIKEANSAPKQPEVMSSKPKAAQSPSVTSTRLRRRKNNQKEQIVKPVSRSFRYSSLVELATRNQSGGVEAEDSHPAVLDLDADTVWGVNHMSAIVEMPGDDVIREESSSLNLMNDSYWAARNLIVVSEQGSKLLKSVLKRHIPAEAHETKHVHFHLPSISNAKR